MESRLVRLYKSQPLIQRDCPAGLFDVQSHRPARFPRLGKKFRNQGSPDPRASIFRQQRDIGQPDLAVRSHDYDLANRLFRFQYDPAIHVEVLDLVMPLLPAKLQLQESVLPCLVPSEGCYLVSPGAAVELVQERLVAQLSRPQRDGSNLLAGLTRQCLWSHIELARKVFRHLLPTYKLSEQGIGYRSPQPK